MRTRAIVLLVIFLGVFLPAGAVSGLGDPRPAEGAMLPGTVAVDDQSQREVLRALMAAADHTKGAGYYAITDIRREDRWQFVSVAGFDRAASDQSWTLDDAVWVGLVLLQQGDDGRWSGAVEGTEDFSQMLAAAPEHVLDGRARANLDPSLSTDVSSESYVFPWQPWTHMMYGMAGVHDAGFPSVVDGWKAVDFLSDGNTALGHAPNQLLAAAPGTISYVCRDATSVAIRVGELMYVHLRDNDSLEVGHTFDLREQIGELRTGAFSDVCGWTPQAESWFHLHWGFPDTGTFEADGWTLNLSDGWWRREDEIAGIYSWFEAQPIATPAGTTGRASVASSGAEGDGGSYGPSISAYGRYIAFSSSARDIVPSDTNGEVDSFVHDRYKGGTERISLSSTGLQGNGISSQPAISADGRYVAFLSYATNLVPSDANNHPDIFVRDRTTGWTELVSVSSDGFQTNGNSYDPAISGNGRYVVFSSLADNLVNGDSNESSDIFLHDRETGLTTRVSLPNEGGQANGGSVVPSVSADGRYIGYWSWADNVVSDDTNGQPDVFRYDRLAGQTLRVSVASDGSQALGETSAPLAAPALSADGRFVAFHSGAWNLVGADANATEDIFVHDCEAGITQRASVSSSGSEANAWSRFPAISHDGRYVAFASAASNLVCCDSNARSDIFLYDRQAGRTERLSLHTDGTQGDEDSTAPAISRDGRYVAFDSLAGNLVTGDNNSADDVFVHDREGNWPYTVSGRVVHPNLLPVPGASVSGGALLTTTDASGAYAFALEVDGTYTVTASLAPYLFWPSQQTVRVPSDALGRSFTMLATPVSTTLSPDSTTAVSYLDTQGLTTTLTFPAGAVSESVTVVITPTLTPHLSDHAFTGHAFQLAALREGMLLPVYTFSIPVTVTVQYGLSDIRLVSEEEQLTLFTQIAAGWVDAASTCTVPLPYDRDLHDRLLTVPICRTGTFGLYGPTHQSHLPLVLRRY